MTELSHKSCLLKYWQEIEWRNKALLRVIPACQCLKAINLLRTQPHLGLKKRGYLALCECVMDLAQ